MARLLIAMGSLNTEVETLFDAMKPESSQPKCLLSAVKVISGFDALHLASFLILVSDISKFNMNQ